MDKSLEAEERVKKIKEKEKQLEKLNQDLGERDESAMLKILMSKERIPFEEEERTYEDAQNRYGLVLGNLNLVS